MTSRRGGRASSSHALARSGINRWEVACANHESKQRRRRFRIREEAEAHYRAHTRQPHERSKAVSTTRPDDRRCAPRRLARQQGQRGTADRAPTYHVTLLRERWGDVPLDAADRQELRQRSLLVRPLRGSRSNG